MGHTSSPQAYLLRVAVVGLIAVVDVVLVVNIVWNALQPADGTSAFSRLLWCRVAGTIAYCSRMLYRWASAARPRPYATVLDAENDPPPRPHEPLSGGVHPPTRW